MSISSVSASTRPSQAASRTGAAEIQLSVCLEGGTPLPAQMLEMARLDLTFITDRPLRFGTVVHLAIFSDVVSAVTQNRGFAHWCRPHARGWQIGVYLTQPLPDRLTSHQWKDLRTTLRYDCNWNAWVLWSESGKPESVRILSYSVSGLRLHLPHPAEANQQFTLFGSSAARGRAVLKGQIQWCRAVGNTFQAGGVIHGQRGRDLPRMFAKLDAVHFDDRHPPEMLNGESPDTLRCEQELQERFLPAGISSPCRRSDSGLQDTSS
jgi:hypothetical protein